MSQQSHFFRRAQRYILTGIFTVIPIWVTWAVFEFIVTQLSKIGKPSAAALAGYLQDQYPKIADWVTTTWIQNSLAVILTILALYLLGWVATRVIGKRVLSLFDLIMHRIPFVKTIYGGVKKFLSVVQTKPEEVQRVVLIEFPSQYMKTVGFVTRILKDENTGRQLAAVYVPTTPNPTSGYLEIVPLEDLVPTDWSIDEAMTFVISGGAIAPENISYDRPQD